MVWATFVQLGWELDPIVADPDNRIVKVDLLENFHDNNVFPVGSTIMRLHASIELAGPAPSVFAGGPADPLVLGVRVANLDSPTDELAPDSSNFGDNWMFLDYLFPSSSVPGNTLSTVDNTVLRWGYKLDLKAKRKIEEMNETGWLVMGLAGGHAIQGSIFGRTLIALP